MTTARQCAVCGAPSITVEEWTHTDPVPRVLDVKLCLPCATRGDYAPTLPFPEDAA